MDGKTRERVLHCKQTGKQLKVIDGELKVVDSCPEGFVDFGLPSGTLWSTKNLGATNSDTLISWYGDYYAWGEIETKESYDWNNYKYAHGSYDTLTKYCDNTDYGYNGFIDNILLLLPEDDAAYQANTEWCTPTVDDFNELTSNTYSLLVSDYNGISGLNGRTFSKVISTTPGFIADGVTLYTIINPSGQSPVDPYPIPQNYLALIVNATIDEMISNFGTDIRPYIYVDDKYTQAEYGKDYSCATKEIDTDKTIFLPMNGRNNNSGESAYYWTSNLFENGGIPDRPGYFNFDVYEQGYYGIDYDGNARCYGCGIRPVIKIS